MNKKVRSPLFTYPIRSIRVERGVMIVLVEAETLTAKMVFDMIDTIAVVACKRRLSRILVESRASNREASMNEMAELVRRIVSVLSGHIALVSDTEHGAFLAGGVNGYAKSVGANLEIKRFSSRDEATKWLRGITALSH